MTQPSLQESIEAALEATAARQHLVGTSIRNPVPAEGVALKLALQPIRDRLNEVLPDYKPWKWSYGNFSFAEAPWVGPKMELKAGDPAFALLFAADGSACFASLHRRSTEQGHLGVSAFADEEMRAWAELARGRLGLLVEQDLSVDLQAEHALARSYQESTVYAARYSRNMVPDEEKIVADITQLCELRERLQTLGVSQIDAYDIAFERAVDAASELPLDELERRAKGAGTKPPRQRSSEGQRYERNPDVAAYARARAKGACDLCRENAPFTKPNGKPHLVAHHVVWLSRGGLDSTDNVVALCPNCHDKMHVLDLAEDAEVLQDLNQQRAQS